MNPETGIGVRPDPWNQSGRYSCLAWRSRGQNDWPSLRVIPSPLEKIVVNYARMTFRSLSSRNYRLFLAGQALSLMGTCVQQTALGWLVYRLTGSPAFLGIVGFCGQIPSFFLAPLAGVLADRFSKQKLIILTQVLSMVQALTLGTLMITGAIRVWHIPVLGLFLGIVNALDIPVRQAFIIETVDKTPHLGNAISLNSSVVNMTRIIGPVLGGFLIARIGEGICFYVNAASFTAVILSMVLMENLAPGMGQNRKPVLGSLKDGFAHAFGSPGIRSVLIPLAVFSLTGVPFVVLLPVFARDILAGGPGTLGLLMGASGAGALFGALYLASQNDENDLEIIMSRALILFGLGIMGFSWSKMPLLSLLMLFIAGFGMMVQIAASNTLIQKRVDDDKRGRIMSIFTMAFIGMIPFGSLLEGMLADRIGAPQTLTAAGLCCLSHVVIAKASQRRHRASDGQRLMFSQQTQ